MKIKRPNVVGLSILVVIIAVLFVMLLPLLMKAPSKYTPIKTRSGIPGVLQQVHMASMDYGVREGKPSSSLDDLAGITVRNSKGEKIPFSIKVLELELGTNASVVKYFPEFRALAFGSVGEDENVLAYVSEFDNTGFCQVIFRNGRIQRIRSSELEKKIDHLKGLLVKSKRESSANSPGTK